MDSQDRIVLALVLVDVAVIVMAGLAGFLIDLTLPGRRWTRWRLSARSVALLCTCMVGTAGLVVVPVVMLAAGVPRTIIAPAGMGPWILALGGAVTFAVSRTVDRKAMPPTP
ncbi:hypothetical protein [Virgisporangium aurantiacum]|uniref:Uncharacterized protein n=1 Tax=Virgisporangium aurantiacum TaxID=175570 RepID=A0A8J4DZS9_9ACTN|nr:hypothetical protein [Virgisporangium aurantiacum]GIJ56259.1 hypothetical protein Vau01_037750 [Virgisporangium aurantiacum]